MVKHSKLRTLKDMLVTGKVDIDAPVLLGVGHTLLHQAIVHNKYEIFSLLLTLGGSFE